MTSAGRGDPGALKRSEIMGLANQYIGVSGGYLGDFTYRTHAEFYAEYCDLEVDLADHQGTTRERFMEILSGLSTTDQAKMLRGALRRFPTGAVGAPATRTVEARRQFEQIASRIEAGQLVRGPAPDLTSDVVRRALADAEHLIGSSGAPSAVDRAHTALHGYLIAACDAAGIPYPEEPAMTALFKLLRRNHPALHQHGARASDIEHVLNACASIIDAMNPVRNKASVAHPNATLLGDEEARLVINVARTLLTYVDDRLRSSGATEETSRS